MAFKPVPLQHVFSKDISLTKTKIFYGKQQHLSLESFHADISILKKCVSTYQYRWN